MNNNAEYSNEERVFIIKTFYGGTSLRTVRDLFSVKFVNRPIPSVSTIHKFVKKFEATASVAADSKGNANIAIFNKYSIKIMNITGKRNNRRNDEMEERVIGMINADHTTSIRCIARECNVSTQSVHKVLKKHGYHPYKPQCHQEVLLMDEESRRVFCEAMQERSNGNRDFLRSICFTDECTFTLNNEPNTQNTRYWAQENPRLVFETRTQFPQKINIWAGILNNNIIGPYEIIGNLNSNSYLNLLINQIGPALEEVAYENQEIWFQHDGCPAHYGLQVREYLNNNFPNCWIGRGGTINWPPRSPDLAPCDFFLWGHLKNNIYKKRHPNVNSLREAIVQQCSLITDRQLANVRRSFYNRLGYCLERNGELFEYLL